MNMKTIKGQSITKLLAIMIIIMGVVHVIATFSPLIAGKLMPLEDKIQQVFIYFSIVCGAFLFVGGFMTYMLSGNVLEHSFVRKPYAFTILALAVNGVLGVFFMPHNIFAWIILALTVLLLFVNLGKLFV